MPKLSPFSPARPRLALGATVVFLALLSGCDQLADLGIPGLGGDDAPKPAAPAPAPQKDAAGQLADARKLLLAGKAADALAAAEKTLAAAPQEDAAWDLVELAALRAGRSAELVDRLSADKAIGDRVDRHHALRGVLAVEAGRLGDALTSAKALQSTAPGDSAALVALAVARGAPLPEGLPAGTVALVAARGGAGPLAPEVEALPGWRAALLRADLLLERGDLAGAALTVARVEAAGPLAAQRLAALRIRAAASPDEAWTAVDPAVKAALEAGDGVGAAELLDAALPASLAGWKGAELSDAAGKVRKQLLEGKNEEGAARVAAVEADAALRAGRPLQAREAATLAAANAAAKPRASWTLALAGAALGDAAAVDAAAAALPEPRATAARDLARALRGETVTLPSAGLEGPDAALQALLALGWAADRAGLAAAALPHAANAPDLALWATLAAGRAPFAAAPDAPGTLLAELAVRASLAGGAGAALPDGSHPAAPAWSALLTNTPGPAGAGVAAWPRLRVALAAGDAAAVASELGTLSIAVPAWRSGPWAPLLALDGPTLADVGADVAATVKLSDPLPAAVVTHGWAHRDAGARIGWAHGVAPFSASATPDQRAAVWDAHARYRAGVLAWAAGRGGWPAEALAALDAAEGAAGLKNFQSPSLAALRASLEGSALFSLRELPGGATEALVLTREGGKLVTLKPTFAKDAAVFLTALRRGDAAVPLGDRLRSQLVDPQMDVLIGIGRYVVVGAPPLGLLPIEAMPEQSDGLRFLASIRHVGHEPDLDAFSSQGPAEEPEWGLTMLALVATPAEGATLQQVYPDARVLVGKDATLAAWREQAPKARFLHVGALPASPGGGVRLADGDLTLAEIAATPLLATSVSVAAPDLDVASGRVTALRRAGVRDVLVQGPSADAGFDDRLLLHFWEGVNRRFNASRSLSEARSLAIRESGDPFPGPGTWGAWFVSGRP